MYNYVKWIFYTNIKSNKKLFAWGGKIWLIAKKCGNQIDDNAVVCPYCGVQQRDLVSQNDNGGFLWGLLGCCIPLVGLILFLVWKDTKPKTAKAAGIGALVSVGIGIIYYILAIVIGIGAAII